MAVQRYRVYYCLRYSAINGICRFISPFIGSLIILVLFINYYFRKPTHENFERSNDYLTYAKPLYLLNKQKVLLPISINRLYDHQVVCASPNGILNRSQLIEELTNNCQTNLTGSLTIDLNPPDDFQIRSSSTLKYAQSWKTTDVCPIFLKERIAIIISYRDREKNLRNLLYNLVPLLKRQKVSNYKIFVIEQEATGPFNKGRLYNVAFHHLMETYKPTCIIFHGIFKKCIEFLLYLFAFCLDADLIPENDQNLYTCSSLTDHPLHMSANVRFQMKNSYTKIYEFLVGGVLTVRPETFFVLNGYSNEYFNWGGEDDDIGLRFLSKDVCVQRPTTGYYFATSHETQTRNANRFRLLFDAVLRQDSDGLNNIDRLAVITNTFEYPLVTWMTVKWIDRI